MSLEPGRHPLGPRAERLYISEAEQRVVDLLLQGLTNKDIAKALGLAEKTVKFHLSNVYQRNKIKTRAQLIIKVFAVQRYQKLTPLGSK